MRMITRTKSNFKFLDRIVERQQKDNERKQRNRSRIIEAHQMMPNASVDVVFVVYGPGD